MKRILRAYSLDILKHFQGKLGNTLRKDKIFQDGVPLLEERSKPHQLPKNGLKY